MILDTSAIVSIFFRDHDHEKILAKLIKAKVTAIGSPTLVETGIVLTAKVGNQGKAMLSQFLQENRTSIVNFGQDHFSVAISAFEKYGKGRHKAALNFGDCLTYAVAKLANQPLLFVGKDFSETDLKVA